MGRLEVTQLILDKLVEGVKDRMESGEMKISEACDPFPADDLSFGTFTVNIEGHDFFVHVYDGGKD
jgi:hypothetical protein